MKKALFYIPAIALVLFYGFIFLTAIGNISPVVLGWLILFIVAGILLSMGKFWGCLLGMLPAIHLIYMSTRETGQIVDLEFPIGIIILVFYAVCGHYLFKKNAIKKNK